jgi:hypothetical protein
MSEYVCDRCGEIDPVGTVSCLSWHAVLAWDQVEVITFQQSTSARSGTR